MTRLATENKNTPQEYDRIFHERSTKDVDEHDLRRWKKMLKHYDGGKLLDIGCLDSKIPELAIAKYPEALITGIDVATCAVKRMEVRYPFANFHTMDANNMTFPPETFDFVVMGEYLEHVLEPWVAVRRAQKVLKKGGWLVISVPYNETKAGEVDKERHLWSFDKEDFRDMFVGPLEFSTVGSRFFPYYRYCFPSLIVFWKNV